MELIQLTERIFFYPHSPETDRPMLAYLKGSKLSLAIDAGYSANHVDEFYQSFHSFQLKTPDFTVITHWHYDHTFGMHHIQGLSIAHEKTNEFLKKEMKKAADKDYINILKKEDCFFKKEYAKEQALNIVLSDIQFQTELVFNLGGLTAKIFHTESPHSEDTVCIYVPEEKALFLGDSISEDFFNNGYMDKSKLEKLIKMISNTDCVYCILSHAEPLKKEELLNYLNSILESKI